MTAHQSFQYSPLNSSLAEAADQQRLGEILSQCFISPLSYSDLYFDRIGAENFRIVRHQGNLIGGLALIPMGQWYGGQRVPMTGVAAVGIAPEARGSGGAIALMQQAVQEMHQQGVALSALYPAAQRLYRQVGYEQGGFYCGWSIPSRQIQVRSQDLPIVAIAPQRQQLEPLYQQYAPQQNGWLDRHSCLWRSLLEISEDERIYAYSLGTETQNAAAQAEGYMLFVQNGQEGQAVLVVKDWVTLSAAAQQSFWAFMNRHRSQIDSIHWKGSIVDSLTFALPEQPVKSRFLERWMLRIINVSAALTARGYPSHLEAELHLHITDDLLPDNSGKYILSVAQGKAEVTAGGTGAMQLAIAGLAPLYSGLYTAPALQRLGLLDAPDDALTLASALFAGDPPWMPDFF